jgi:uncharacterized protein YecE (DUF72 family)
MTNPHVHIGTSGWTYDGWMGKFYPEDVKSRDLLPEYAKTFDTVELNTSFYHLPKATSVEQWNHKSPGDFIFSYKASRYITHRKKLKDPHKGLDRMLDTVTRFDKKLGPILFQLPPHWKLNFQRLREFIEALPSKYRYTFEFRDRSWLCEEVYKLLEGHNIALCFYDYRGFRCPERVTADFIYLRLHGPNPEAYTGSYDGRTLAAYARKIQGWLGEGKDVFCYFDNDQKAYAPSDARRLRDKLETRSRTLH